jgi:hypothetical protein
MKPGSSRLREMKRYHAYKDSGIERIGAKRYVYANEPVYALLDRFKKTWKHVQCFDILIGLNDDKIKTL